jgi:hypothetical protein
MDRSIDDGFGSRANGRTAESRPPLTSAVSAPQWVALRRNVRDSDEFVITSPIAQGPIISATAVGA